MKPSYLSLLSIVLFTGISTSALAGDPETPLDSLVPGTVIHVEKAIPIYRNNYGESFTNGSLVPELTININTTLGTNCWIIRNDMAVFDYTIEVGTSFSVSQKPSTMWSERILQVFQGYQVSSPAYFYTIIPLTENSEHISAIGCYVHDKDQPERKPLAYDFTAHVGGYLKIDLLN